MSAGFVVRFGHTQFFASADDAQVLMKLLPRCFTVYSRWENQEDVYYKDSDQTLSFRSVETIPEIKDVKES